MTTRVLVTNLGSVGTEKAKYISVSTIAPTSGEKREVAKIAPGGYADFYVHQFQSLVVDEKEI